MDISLLKKLGNISQIAGIREARLLHGRGEGIAVAEMYNAAGLRFSVIPDRCMDIFDLSYKGVNFSFQSKNGLTSPQSFTSANKEFAEQWPAGLMVTCGLDNVGGHCEDDGIYPTHGRTNSVPAQNFGTESYWEGDDYILRATGEIHQTKMFGRHLSIRRTIETSLHAKTIEIHDIITNFEAEDEPYMLLYHCNFGYPLLCGESQVLTSKADKAPMNSQSKDSVHMTDPADGSGEELFFYTNLGDRACGAIINPVLDLGAYIEFDTANLPNFLEWKRMKSHDYVLAIEPCNTWGMARDAAKEQGRIAVLPAYSSVENRLKIGVLDGKEEIARFVAGLEK